MILSFPMKQVSFSKNNKEKLAMRCECRAEARKSREVAIKLTLSIPTIIAHARQIERIYWFT